jgi:hypothetical protein
MPGSGHGRHRSVTGDRAAQVATSPGWACALAGSYPCQGAGSSLSRPPEYNASARQLGTEGAGPGGVRRACTRILASGCLKPDPLLRSCSPAGGLPGGLRGSRGYTGRGGDPDEQGDEAASPSPAGLLVNPVASRVDQQRSRRERRRDQKKRDHHPRVCLSPVRHGIAARHAVDAA